MMLKRVVSGVLSFLVLIFVLLQEYVVLVAAIMIISTIALLELYKAFENININPAKKTGVIITAVLIYCATNTLTLPLLSVALLTLSVTLVFNFEKYNIVDLAITLFGVIYIGSTLAHLLLFINVENFYLIWLVFIIASATDTFAYFSGHFFGKKKLCPKISPQKTVQGAIGGIFGSMLISGIFAYLLIPKFLFPIIFLGFFGSILSQVGDMFASAIKRHIGIKDFGNIIPGHGGILDRIDSIIFTAPAVYYFMIYVIM